MFLAQILRLLEEQSLPKRSWAADSANQIICLFRQRKVLTGPFVPWRRWRRFAAIMRRGQRQTCSCIHTLRRITWGFWVGQSPLRRLHWITRGQRLYPLSRQDCTHLLLGQIRAETLQGFLDILSGIHSPPPLSPPGVLSLTFLCLRCPLLAPNECGTDI